ncbi:MAG: DUF4405 domain-containing protein [Acutalibacteraceae bacterium]
MKRNTILKIFIDVTMTVLYAMLMFAKGMGGFFHEAVGIGIGIIFAIHIILNYSMIKGLFKSAKKGKAEKVFLLVSDIVLTVCMPVVIVTGILIARELFTVDSGISWTLLFNIHNTLSYVCLAVMLLHILFHKRYLVGVAKKLPKAFSGKEMKSAVGRFAAGALVAVALYLSLFAFKNISDNQSCQSCPNKSDCTNSSCTDLATSQDASSGITQPGTSAIEESSSSVTANENPLIIDNNTDEIITSQENVTSQDSTSQTGAVATPTLEEYLSALNCGGCSKNCSLLNPRCGKGQEKAEQAKEEYYKIYG